MSLTMFLVMNMYATPLHMVMNKASWGKISPDDQQLIKDLLEEFPQKIGEQYIREDQAGYREG
jgi:TRAP-type C4-dicarboxylate transport system substrate-binding protein